MIEYKERYTSFFGDLNLKNLNEIQSLLKKKVSVDLKHHNNKIFPEPCINNETKMKIDFYDLVLNGFTDPVEKLNLSNYFFRKFKEAEKDNYDTSSFFGGCKYVLQKFEEELNDKYQKRKGELYQMKTLAQTKQISYDPDPSKTYDQRCTETIEYCDSELKSVSLNDFSITLSGKYFGHLWYKDINYLKEAIDEARKKFDQKWDTFYDEIDWSKYDEDGIAILRRKYSKGDSYLEAYMSHPELAPIAAKGISAYLSFWSYSRFKSFRLLLYENAKLDLEKSFNDYFLHCKRFLDEEEKRKPFKKDKKSEIELVDYHIDLEEKFFNESILLFKEVKDSEKPNIEIIREAALYYPKWVKENYLKKDSSDNLKNNGITTAKSKTKSIKNYSTKKILEQITNNVNSLLNKSAKHNYLEEFRIKFSFIPEDKWLEFFWNELLTIQNHIFNDYRAEFKESIATACEVYRNYFKYHIESRDNIPDFILKSTKDFFDSWINLFIDKYTYTIDDLSEDQLLCDLFEINFEDGAFEILDYPKVAELIDCLQAIKYFHFIFKFHFDEQNKRNSKKEDQIMENKSSSHELLKGDLDPNIDSQQNTFPEFIHSESHSAKSKIIPKPISPPVKLISFDGPETIKRLHEELKGFFQNKESELERALNGEKIDIPLIFPHNGNKFVEVFKRVKYNGYLLSNPTEIRDWICACFMFRYKRGKKPEIRAFNQHTVWDILTKDKDPTKKERICNVDWLPYICHEKLKREAEKEKL